MSQQEAYKLYTTGNELRARNRDIEALETYQKALTIHPALWQAQKGIDEILQAQEKKYLQLADLHMADGKTDKAESELKHVLKINPNSWKAHKNLAQIYLSKNDLVKAIVELKKAIVISPNLCGLHLTLAKMYDMMENFTLALEEYDRALKTNPRDTVILKQKELTQKIAKFYTDPKHMENPFVLSEISHLYLEKEMPEIAIQKLEKALGLSKNNQEIIYNLANACYKLKDFEKAIQHYEQAAAIEPNLIKLDELYYNLGLSHSAMNHFEEAINCMGKCIEIEPYGKASARAEESIQLLRVQLRHSA